jgi:hypothetical protein
MKKLMKSVIIMMIMIATFSSSVFAISKTDTVVIQSIPLEVSMTLNKTLYFPNEIVTVTARIAGGSVGEKYYVTLTDDTGYSFFMETAYPKIVFNRDSYPSGVHTIQIRVTADMHPGQVAYDSKSFTQR